MFGFTWLHQASVVAIVGNLDPGGLLQASTVEKHHLLEWAAGSHITVLTSPDGDEYILVSRDAQRTSDTPTMPAGWTLDERLLSSDLPIQLPLHTTVIRTDNEDSFQGPVPANILPLPVPFLPTTGLVVLGVCLLSTGTALARSHRGGSETGGGRSVRRQVVVRSHDHAVVVDLIEAAGLGRESARLLPASLW